MSGPRKAALSILLLVSASATPQQSVPPPPKPPDNGPSLEATMRFIQQKIGDLGRLNYTAFGVDTTDSNSTYTQRVSVQYTTVGYGEAACLLTYHVKRVVEGDTVLNADIQLSLREVEDITLEPEEQRLTKRIQGHGEPNTVYTRSQPATLALVIHRPHNVEDLVDFQDAGIADRVAKAFTHAVELCGGGNKDPF